MNEITYQREYCDDVDDSWVALFNAHYEEIAWNKSKIPLRPNLKKYASMEANGAMVCYTARQDEKIIGYAVWFITEHPHYQDTKMAMNDIIYIAKEKRGSMTGIKLLEYSENKLKGLGVQTIGLHIKKVFDWGKVAERIGYECVESTYQKWVGD